MNYLWGGMILVGIVYGALSGNMQAVTDEAINSAKEAVTLCITMVGVMALWVGIMEIAKEAGLIDAMARKIRPIVRFLFPGIPEGHDANEHISMNMIAKAACIIRLNKELRTMKALFSPFFSFHQIFYIWIM